MTRQPGITLAAALALTACSNPSWAQVHLGTIDFPTSGSAAAVPHFNRGVLFLHSFEYDSAANHFRIAQKVDPAFAMAYWGEAMTHTHAVWDEQNAAEARAVLGRLAPNAGARKTKTPTAREKQYLEAVEILYGEGSKPRRDTLYSQAMKRLADAYPADMEAKAFYALSLIGLNQGVRDVVTYERAGKIVEPIFAANPDHPGAAHYIIHAYDDPGHAAQGLNAARAYSKIAPGAAHAQHMTTHIFLALGMWDDVVSQNEVASGHDHDAWTPGHYTSWLNYAYLQQGRSKDALHMLERMAPAPGKALGSRRLSEFMWMRARYLVESEEWDSPPATWNVDLATLGREQSSRWAFVTGLRSVRKQDITTASTSLAVLSRANASAGASAGVASIILEKELAALVRMKEGKTDEAIALMRDATRLEDTMPEEFGPPAVIKPSHELFGEMLLELGKAKDARAEFKRALELAPKRARSLLGLARAAKAMGDSAGASKAYGELQAVWHRADPELRATSQR